MLVVAGTAWRGSSTTSLIAARLFPGGQSDGEFGAGGTLVLDQDHGVEAAGLAVLPDGRVLIAGTVTGADGNRDMTVVRLLRPAR